MAHPDLETLVSLLSTIVSKGEEDDWNFFERGLTRVKNPINDKHVIGGKKFVWGVHVDQGGL